MHQARLFYIWCTWGPGKKPQPVYWQHGFSVGSGSHRRNKPDLTLYINHTKNWLFTSLLFKRATYRTESSVSKKEREKEIRSKPTEREGEAGERKICYVTLESANLLIMLLVFLSENFYGCFVYSVLQNNESDKMESMRTAASRLFPLGIFTTYLTWYEEGTETTGSTVTVLVSVVFCRQWSSERDDRGVVCLCHILCSAVFWSCRDMDLTH